MAIAPTAPPSISELPPAPNSSSDSASEFDIKANATVAAQVSMIPQINSANDWTESTADEVYQNALEANNSATVANAVASLSNYLGVWSDLSGAKNKGGSTFHDGGIWVLLYDIADVALTEPSLSNTDYMLVNAEGKAVPIPDGVTLNPNIINSIPSTQQNNLPLAATVPANTRLLISVQKKHGGITTTHLVSGSDTTTDKFGNSDGFIFNWPNGGTIFVTSNGLDNWSL